jgi:flagellar basal body rod protein FlgG
VANVDSDRFKKTKVTLLEGDPQGVTVHLQKIEDPGPMVYEQTNEGQKLVEKSNVNLTEELPNLILSRKFYQANIKGIQTEDEMLGNLLDTKS